MSCTYTNDWFNEVIKNWDAIIPALKPQKYLEIGSYEGRSICYLIDKIGDLLDLEIHAVDTWQGGEDYQSKQLMATVAMSTVEATFKLNVQETIAAAKKKIDVFVHKGRSDKELAKLLDKYENYFDLIYVDGSHTTSDTLCDMVLSFKLLRPGGMMIVDDYLWHVDQNPDFRPKLAIDAFINLHLSKVGIFQAMNQQAYFFKNTL